MIFHLVISGLFEMDDLVWSHLSLFGTPEWSIHIGVWLWNDHVCQLVHINHWEDDSYGMSIRQSKEKVYHSQKKSSFKITNNFGEISVIHQLVKKNLAIPVLEIVRIKLIIKLQIESFSTWTAFRTQLDIANKLNALALCSSEGIPPQVEELTIQFLFSAQCR